MKMKRISLLVAFFIAFGINVFAQLPDWVSPQFRASKYSDSKFLSAFVAEINHKNEGVSDLLQRIEGYAKDQLAENIMVDIRAVTTLNIHNLNAKSQEEFKRSSTSVSGAKLAGLRIERHYDDKKKTAYVFAYAAKADVLKLYEQDIDKHLNAIKQSMQLLQGSNNERKLKHLFEAQQSLRKIEEAQAMIVAISGSYPKDKLKKEEADELEIKINKLVNDLMNANELDIDGAAYFLAYSLKTQMNSLPAPVKIHGITYQDTPMSSQFSRRLINSLSQRLVTDAGYQIASPEIQETFYVLFGNYWEEEGQLKLSLFLREEQSGETIAASTCKIAIQKLSESGVVFKPENYRQAMENMQLFAQNELKGGELRVDVLTNKGKGNQIYVQGESLRLFVRANRECYLRFIYHLADGSQVLLLDNYYINRDLVNQVYELPYEFECDEPFGVETLQLNAQTVPFESLYTKREYGYDFITEDPIETITKTRGFKRKADEVMKAEQRLIFTTMRR